MQECASHPEATAFQFNPPEPPCGDDCETPCVDQDAEVTDWLGEELGVPEAQTCADMLAAVPDLCDIWDGYISNNVCPTTCSNDCSMWGGIGAFCGCMVLEDGVTFADAIDGPHIHDEATECTICNLAVSSSAQCALSGDSNGDGGVDVVDLLMVLGAFGCTCDGCN